MSARNMVRNLRDSGALDGKPPGPEWRSTLLGFAGGLAFGAIAYLGAAFGLPAMGPLFTKPPPVVSYAKPGGRVELVSLPAVRPFGEADALACDRYAKGIEKRKRDEFMREALTGDFLSVGLKANTEAFYRLSAEIICVAQTRPMRFCDPSQRADLYARVKEPLTFMRGLMKLFASDVAASDGPHAEILAKQREAAEAEFGKANRQVITTFRDLARRGLLSGADFPEGMFGAVHPVLAPAFADLPAIQGVCPEA